MQRLEDIERMGRLGIIASFQPTHGVSRSLTTFPGATTDLSGDCSYERHGICREEDRVGAHQGRLRLAQLTRVSPRFAIVQAPLTTTLSEEDRNRFHLSLLAVDLTAPVLLSRSVPTFLSRASTRLRGCTLPWHANGRMVTAHMASMAGESEESSLVLWPRKRLPDHWVLATGQSSPHRYPEERLTMMETLRGFTTAAAQATIGSCASQAGTLRVGSFADFVVVDGDPLQLGTAPLEGESPTERKEREAKLRGIKVVTTVVGGKAVWGRGL